MESRAKWLMRHMVSEHQHAAALEIQVFQQNEVKPCEAQDQSGNLHKFLLCARLHSRQLASSLRKVRDQRQGGCRTYMETTLMLIYCGRLSLSGSQDLISALIIGAVLYDSC